MRIMWRAGVLGALIAASLMLSNGTLRANDAPVVHVSAMVKDGDVRVQAEANGPFEYTTYRPSASLYVIDLSGVSAGDPAGARVVPSDLLKGYRVISYASGEKPVVRVEILLAPGVEPNVERKDKQELTLLVSKTSNANSQAIAPNSQPLAESAAVVPVAADVSGEKSGVEAIRDVRLIQNGGATEVTISGSGSLVYHSQHLQNPDRLVLDFDGSQLVTSEKHIASNLDPVREIRLAQFSPRVSRVVIDLREPARYAIKSDGSIVTVSFMAKTSGADAAAPAANVAPVVTTKSEMPHRTSPTVVQSAAITSAGIPAPAAILPVALTQPESALATPSSAQPQQEAVAAVKLAHEVSPDPTNGGNEASTASETMPAAPRREAARMPAQNPPPVQTGKFSGEPISVNLKDVDLRDFFRLIHEISGLNVVVDPSVKGNLTIVLDDVPWDQALDIVLRNNDLDRQLDGNVLRIATKQTLRREAEENRDLAKAQAEAADVVTTTRVLSYAKATAMAITLKKFLSSRGDIISDDRSNTLIIRDIPSTLPVMDNLIRQLDRKSQQVEIEARVVAANRSFSREIGTEFGISTAFTTGGGISGFSGDPGVGPSPITFTPAPPIIVGTGGTTATSGQIPQVTNLGTAAPTSGFQYLYQSKNFALDMIINAAEDRGVGKLLSKPKIITQNNEKATVQQGTKIPVQTIVNNTVSVQFVNAVLELDVTPQITADGTVYMDVTVENDQIDAAIPRIEGIPAIDTQSAETKVTVNDGATVVIGGIIVTQQRTDIQEVPFVGSIPVLGNLFKHTTVSSSSNELLFFLTPRILPS
jgi:type IV pilus secretin PilQ/predicted competence protein